MKKLDTEEPDEDTVAFAGARSKVKKIHLLVAAVIVCVILLIICIVLAVLYSHAVRRPKVQVEKPSKDYEICDEERCFEFGKAMVLNMNKSVNPCDDFYAYACGRWPERNPLDNTSSFSSVFQILKEKNYGVLIDALNKAKVNYSKTDDAIMKTVRFYRSCVNTSDLASMGMEPLMKLVTKYGGWGILNNFDSSVSLETRIARTTRELDVGSLFDTGVYIDRYNSSNNLLVMFYAQTTFPSSFYLNKSEAVQKEVKEKISKLSKLFGINGTEAKFKALYDFETKLAKIYRGKSPDEELMESVKRSIMERKEIKDHRIKLKDFCTKSGFSCDRIKTILNMTYGRTFTGEELLLVTNITYFKILAKFIEDTISSGNGQVISDYVMWRVVYKYIDGKILQDNYTSPSNDPPGTKERVCINRMSHGFGMSLGLLYVNASFHEEAKKRLEEMTEDIKKAFIDRLKDQTWMDPETRRRAKEKALAINAFIGYPSYIKDPKKLNEEYKLLKVTNDYFANIIARDHFNRMKQINSYGKPNDRGSWNQYMSPFITNAFYDPMKNAMTYLAGMIQPPFYSPGYPKYMQYGAIGMVIGHELTHGFDSSGRQYDKDGNLRDWWSASADDSFKEKAKCLKDQYNQYSFYGVKVNGTWTINENIADNGGLQITYDAYQNWINKHGTENILPGLKLSPDQLFFVAFAQQWCSVYTAQGVEDRKYDTHTTQKYRVIGTLSNFDKFSEAFQCPVDSRMNPTKKCSVW